MARDVGKMLRKRGIRSIAIARQKALRIFSSCQRTLQRITLIAVQDPRRFFCELLLVYPSYFGAVGVYNTLWRYVNYRSDTDPQFSTSLLTQLQDERNRIALLYYPSIEDLIIRASFAFAKEEDMKGSFVSFLTASELDSILVKKKNFSSAKKKCEKRGKGYFYSCDIKKEGVSSQSLLFC